MRDADDVGTGGSWSPIGLGAVWMGVFLVWWVIGFVALGRPGFLADVPPAVTWTFWAVLTPLAVVAVIASVSRSFHMPVRRGALRIAFVGMAATGSLSLLLLPLRLDPHPFPLIGAFLVASVGTAAYWVAVELGR